MNLVYAEVVEVVPEDGLRMATIRVGGALTKAALALVADAQRGDVVLLCDGVAIGKVKEESHVSGNSR